MYFIFSALISVISTSLFSAPWGGDDILGMLIEGTLSNDLPALKGHDLKGLEDQTPENVFRYLVLFASTQDGNPHATYVHHHYLGRVQPAALLSLLREAITFGEYGAVCYLVIDYNVPVTNEIRDLAQRVEPDPQVEGDEKTLQRIRDFLDEH